MSAEIPALQVANETFYKALEELDLGAMERLWLHEGWVRCIHPGWDALVGWESVRQSWQQIFANTRWIRVTPTAIEAAAFGSMGVVACSENITATNPSSEGEVGMAVAQATNLYRLTPDGWRMIHHHASPAPMRVTQPFSGTRQ
jgi:ketosteroid isomerase-like protein